MKSQIYSSGASVGPEANALQLHWHGIFHRNIAAAVEIREAAEGRAPTRIEFLSQNDRLEELLACFRQAANAARIDREQKEKEEKPPN